MDNKDLEREISWLIRDKYDGVISTNAIADIERLRSGEPLAYVIGWIPFLGTKIYLDSKPLIPRAETEYWVGQLIETLKARKLSEVRILDLCAGSGCIGVALANALPESTFDFVEIDPSHIATIWKNIDESKIDRSRTQVITGDLFEKIDDKYDLIVSNPPYINKSLKDRVEDSVKIFEPEIALYADDRGLEIIKRIVNEAPQFLKDEGMIFIEHEPEQTEEISLLPNYKGTFDDQYGVKRYSQF